MNARTSILTACLTAALLASASGPLRAQTFRGAILGTVVDKSQAPVPGAQVTTKNMATGLTRATMTDDTGQYQVPELPLGQYMVTVEKPGFETITIRGALVEVAKETRVDATLEPGRVETRIDVKAEVPLVQTTTNILGGTVEAPQIVNLPVNGRDYIKLVYMNPGITGSPDQATDSPGSFGLFSSNGARGRSNNYLLDGTDMNDGYRNLPAINQAGVFGTPATILPVEAVAEIAVLSNFEPEYGRNAGAVVNIVTKSGTNEVHGSLSEYFRNDRLDARNFFNLEPNPKTSFRNSQFGGAAGGPIRRDKTFVFVDYEGQREKVGLNSLARVPTAAEIADQTAALVNAGGGVNPVISALLARNPWPQPNINPGAPLYDPNPNVSVTTPASNRVDSLIAKVDHNFNTNNMVTARYYLGDSDQSFPLALVGGGVLPGYNTVTPTTVHLVSVSYVRVLSSTQVNEARFGYNRFYETFFPEDSGFDPSSIGLNTGVDKRDTGLPQIRFSGYASIGATLSTPRGRTDTNWQFIDSFSWKRGRHEMKFGYEFRRTSVNGFFDAGYRGRLDFRSGDMQNSLYDFLAGIPTGGRQAKGASDRETFQNSHAGYFQDSYRMNPKFTVNYGVRWDDYGVIGEKHNLLSNFDPAVGLVMVGSGQVGGVGAPTMRTIPRLYDRDLNNFAPRLSLAYDLTGKGQTVIRAGYGFFYDVFSQDFFTGQLPWNTFNPGPAYNPIGPAAVLFAFDVNRDANGDALPLDAGTPIFPDANFYDSDVFAVDRHARTPYMSNYNVNVQQQLGGHAMLQVGYVGSQGRKLFRYRDINQPPEPWVSTARPFDNGPFAPSGGTFFYVNNIETSAISNYNALQATFRLRGLRGFESTVNYTWAHSIDNASDGQDFVTNATQPENSFRPDLERGNSNFDVRQRLVWNFIYEFPKWGQGRWAKITDGWQANAVLTLQTGQPFHVNLFDDYNGTGEFFPRPDLVGDPWAGTHSPDRFLNLAAFRVPCTFAPGSENDPDIAGSAAACDPATFHFGNLGRNSLRGPDFRNLDFSIFKNTPITEQVTLQFRAEFFNLANHPNFANPYLPGFAADASYNGIDPVTGRGIDFLPLTVTGDVGIGNPFLGGGGPRNIQLALKLLF
ncbi:MAG: carboxypeptidase regulatory-like domain-containing protein [Terriglobia bacterium]